MIKIISFCVNVSVLFESTNCFHVKSFALLPVYLHLLLASNVTARYSNQLHPGGAKTVVQHIKGELRLLPLSHADDSGFPKTN